MERISVIIPVYNVEKYIKECLESVLNQTYKDFDIIIIDDGSTDRTAEIIQGYRMEHTNILYIRQQNQGSAAARNTGLSYAENEYVSFVDGDDILNLNTFKRQMEQMKTQSADVVFVKLKEFRGQAPINTAHNNCKALVYERMEALKYYFKIKQGNVCAGIFKRKLFENVKFPEGTLFEDNYPKARVLFQSKKTVFMQEPFYYYRINQKSNTRQRFNSKKYDAILSGQMIEEFLRHNDPHFKYYKNEFYQFISYLAYRSFKEGMKSGELMYSTRNAEITIRYTLKILVLGIVYKPEELGTFFKVIQHLIREKFMKINQR